MFRKLTLRGFALGLFAAASLGAAALSPSSASAHGFGWHHHHHFGPRLIVVGGYRGCYVMRPVLTPWGYRMRPVNVCY